MDATVPSEDGLGPVVAGTDGSGQATEAVLWAAAEASARGRPLTVVHGVGDERQGYWTAEEAVAVFEEGRRLLDRAETAVAEHFPQLPVSTVLSKGGSAESLLETAQPQDTLVVGSRGRGGFASLMLGSVGLRVAARSRGPVIVVREVPAPRTGAVVAAVRDDGDRGALRFAARTAVAHGAQLRVVSVWKFLENVGSMAAAVDDVSAIARSEAEATRRTVGPVRDEFPGLAIEEDVLRSGSVAGSLVEASSAADLVVMGARRPAHALGAGLGRVTHAVLHHAHCPVAVLPR